MRWLYILPVLLLLTSGCGTMHIGSVSHTHVYGRGQLDSDEAFKGKLGKIIAYIVKVSGEEEPLKGFEWNEKKITALEKEQKEKGSNDKNNDVFNENF